MEKASEEAAAKLSASILARYHEEQIWSDKIRRMSTWGTWGLMGVNILLFLVFQIGVEPWRRRRLVKGFEEKVMEALDKEGVPAVGAHQGPGKEVGPLNLDEGPMEEAPVIEQETLPRTEQVDVTPERIEGQPNSIVAEPQEPPLAPKTMSSIGGMKENLRDMFSDREIRLRRVDLTNAMLEGAAAGVAFVGVLVLLLRPR